MSNQGQSGEAGKQNPPSREKQREFAEAEPHAFDLRSDDHGGHLQKRPDDEIGKKNAHGPCGRCAEQQSGAAHQHQYARAVSQSRAPRYPWGHGLPHHGKIAVDERENAEADHSDGEEGNRGLKAWLRALRDDGSWSGVAGNFEDGGWLDSSHRNMNRSKNRKSRQLISVPPTRESFEPA